MSPADRPEVNTADHRTNPAPAVPYAVWAPNAQDVDLLLVTDTPGARHGEQDRWAGAIAHAMEPGDGGWWVPSQELLALYAPGGPQEGENPEPNMDADRTHPLFGQVIVFTGNLSVPRPKAKQWAANYGAQTASRVTRATTALVVGDGFVPQDLANGRLTNKAKQVLKLRDKGQRVEIISEGEFMQLVEGFGMAVQG